MSTELDIHASKVSRVFLRLIRLDELSGDEILVSSHNTLPSARVTLYHVKKKNSTQTRQKSVFRFFVSFEGVIEPEFTGGISPGSSRLVKTTNSHNTGVPIPAQACVFPIVIFFPFERHGQAVGPPRATKASQAPPEVVCVEEAIELGVYGDDADITAVSPPHDGPADLTGAVVDIGVDAEGAIDLQLQDILVLGGDAVDVLESDALGPGVVQDAQVVAQGAQLAVQALALDLQLAGGFGDAELGRVEGQDALGVGAGVVAGQVAFQSGAAVGGLAVEGGEGLRVGLEA